MDKLTILPQIEPRGFTIFTKTMCPFCDKVKELLKDQPLVSVVVCDEYLATERDVFLSYIKEAAGREYKTFPMVFHDGDFVGGFTDTQAWVHLEQERRDLEDAFDEV
jgi:glutaredoxin